MSNHLSGFITWNITATLLEDTHPGSGMGGGGIDALISRDRDGKPVIWASHFEGLLRSAASTIYPGKVEQLFGARGGARQQAIFTSLYATTSPQTRIWRSSARKSFDNRAAKDDTLQVREYVPKETIFKGQAHIPRADEATFQRLLLEVRAIGQGRTGGAGRIDLRHDIAAPSQPASPSGITSSRLLLLFQNIDPVCIAATGRPDNLIPTAAFIPGRTLQGALAFWLYTEGFAAEAQELVEGKISVSDALPFSDKNLASDQLSQVSIIPAPLAALSVKPVAHSLTIPWWVQSFPEPRRYNALIEGQAEGTKRPGDKLFLYRIGADSWKAYEPTIRVRLRSAYSQTEDANLFAIEHIAERTKFLAEIEGDQHKLAALVQALGPVFGRERWLRIGRSGVPVEILASSWAEQRISPALDAKQSGYFLTLTSDLLARDSKLRWITALNPGNLAHIAQWPNNVTLKESPNEKSSAQETTIIYGFNGTSRLRRLPASAIRRGSVFAIQGEGIQRLSEMAAQGIWLGERTHEGFGRFRLDLVLPGCFHPQSESSHSSACQSSQSQSPNNTADLQQTQITSIRHTGDTSCNPHPDESIARETNKWAQIYKASEPGIPISQWHSFLADYQRDSSSALLMRLRPEKESKSCWKHDSAQTILRHLSARTACEPDLSLTYLRYFVRWIRALSSGASLP